MNDEEKGNFGTCDYLETCETTQAYILFVKAEAKWRWFGGRRYLEVGKGGGGHATDDMHEQGQGMLNVNWSELLSNFRELRNFRT